MLNAIFMKEYVKIHWWWAALLLVNGLLMAYIYIDTRHLFIMDHAEIVWYRVMHLDQRYYDGLTYIPAITGLAMACIQYFPEMWGERLRLSLHLPVSPHLLILAHVLVGLTATGIVVGLDLVALAIITARYFPGEAVMTAVMTATPWGLSGIAAYLGVTLGLLEPSYKNKLFNLGVTAGVVALFLNSTLSGGYGKVVYPLGVILLLMVPAVLMPAYRFRYRRVT